MVKTSSRLPENVAGSLCYLLGWVSGIVFVLVEEENTTIRFHAMQSIHTFGLLSIAHFISRWVPVIGDVVGWVIMALALMLWVVLMFKAYQGEKFKLPWVGNKAERWAG